VRVGSEGGCEVSGDGSGQGEVESGVNCEHDVYRWLKVVVKVIVD
jgi:hypothetical protein